jgi:hypothetical protein
MMGYIKNRPQKFSPIFLSVFLPAKTVPPWFCLNQSYFAPLARQYFPFQYRNIVKPQSKSATVRARTFQKYVRAGTVANF